MVVAEELKKVLIFKNLSQEQLETLAQCFSPLELPANTVVFRQGDRGDSFYIIQKGKVQVIISTDKGPVTVATLRDGQAFGEMALMHNDPRSATIETIEPCNLGILDQSEFLNLLAGNPALAVKFNFLVSQRQKEDEKVTRSSVEANAKINKIPFKLVINGRKVEETKKKFLTSMVFLQLHNIQELSRRHPRLLKGAESPGSPLATPPREAEGRAAPPQSMGPAVAIEDSLIRSLAGSGLLASEFLKLKGVFTRISEELPNIRNNSTPMAKGSLDSIEKGLEQSFRFIEILEPYFKLSHLRLTKCPPGQFFSAMLDKFKKKFTVPENKIASLFNQELPYIFLDETLVERMCEELLKNSLAFAPRVCQTNWFIEESDKEIILVMRDSAPKIPERDLKKVFHPFFTTTHRDGVGLGLALAKKIMVAHGGDLVLSALDPHPGNVFRANFPKGR